MDISCYGFSNLLYVSKSSFKKSIPLGSLDVFDWTQTYYIGNDLPRSDPKQQSNYFLTSYKSLRQLIKETTYEQGNRQRVSFGDIGFNRARNYLQFGDRGFYIQKFPDLSFVETELALIKGSVVNEETCIQEIYKNQIC